MRGRSGVVLGGAVLLGLLGVRAEGVWDISLREWTSMCFTHLPCFDHAMRGSDGRIHVHREVEGQPEGVWASFPPRASDEMVLDSAHVEAELRAYLDAAAQSLLDATQWMEEGGVEMVERLRRSGLLDTTELREVQEGAAEGWGSRPRGSFARAGGEAQFPFVGRLLVAEDAVIAVFGDLHGSIHSLLRELGALVERGYLGDDWRVRDEWRGRFHVLFLGDYVDRGEYGIETLWTVLRLLRLNPGAVLATRGNHEDLALNYHGGESAGSFAFEMRSKFGASAASRLLRWVGRAYDTLPLALFVGREPLAAGAWADAPSAWRETARLAEFEGSDARAVEEEEGVGEGVGEGEGVGDLFASRTVPGMSGAGAESGRWSRGRYAHARRARGSFVLACHGGLEVGFDPRPLLQAPAGGGGLLLAAVVALHRGAWLAAQPTGLQSAIPARLHHHFSDYGPGQTAARPWPLAPMGPDPAVGFLWSDFTVDDRDVVLAHTPGRGLVHGLSFTRHWLRTAGVVGVWRAHQHNDNPIAGPMLSRLRHEHGVVDNWAREGIVLTLLSGTECPGFDVHHDSFALFHAAHRSPTRWRLVHCAHRTGTPAVRLRKSDAAWAPFHEPWQADVAARGAFLHPNHSLPLPQAHAPPSTPPSDPPLQTQAHTHPNHPHPLPMPLDAEVHQAATDLVSARRRWLWERYHPHTLVACDITDEFLCLPKSWAARSPTLPPAAILALHTLLAASSPPHPRTNASLQLLRPQQGAVLPHNVSDLTVLARLPPNLPHSPTLCARLIRVRDDAILPALDPLRLRPPLARPPAFPDAHHRPSALGHALALALARPASPTPLQHDPQILHWAQIATARNSVERVAAHVCAPPDADLLFRVHLANLPPGLYGLSIHPQDPDFHPPLAPLHATFAIPGPASS